MDKLKVSVLFWEERTPEGPQHDDVMDQVAKALAENEHTVSMLGVESDLGELIAKVEDQKPDIIFNLCERFADNDTFEMHMTALLDVLGVPYTGTGPAGMALRQDKAVTKKLLKFHQVPYPNFATFDKNKIEFAGNMRFPMFVKPMVGDASIGIDDNSLVTEYSKLVERISFIQNEMKTSALVEEFVDGREFYVGILGNDPAEPLPVMEFDFSKLPAGRTRIYSEKAKLDPESDEFMPVDAVVATDLSPETRARITMAGKEAAYALKTQDYARVDIRLSQDGIPMVVEVNANPHLEITSAFPMAALQSGMPYDTLIGRILELAWTRSQPAPYKKNKDKTKAEKSKSRAQAEEIADKAAAREKGKAKEQETQKEKAAKS